MIKRGGSIGGGMGGHYDKTGKWVRTKFCFVYCGDDRCDCQPPGGVYQIEPEEKQPTLIEIIKSTEIK